MDNKKKILIVDDDEQITGLFAAYFTAQGYEATPINDSSRAIETALKLEPDIVILDLMMPDPDGFKICRLLRTFPRFAATPILIVTALTDEDSKAVAFGAGADEYLAKPFPINDLGDRVKKLLDKVE